MASTEDKPANKESTSSWKDSIYNPRTGELLGRTASSWGKDPPLFASHLRDALTFMALPPNLTPPPHSELSLLCVAVHGWM